MRYTYTDYLRDKAKKNTASTTEVEVKEPTVEVFEPFEVFEDVQVPAPVEETETVQVIIPAEEKTEITDDTVESAPKNKKSKSKKN